MNESEAKRQILEKNKLRRFLREWKTLRVPQIKMQRVATFSGDLVQNNRFPALIDDPEMNEIVDEFRKVRR